MNETKTNRVKSLSFWTFFIPLAGWIIFLLHHYISDSFFLGVIALVLVGCVLVAVQHADTIAHRIGEPFGSLVLSLAVTAIEVSLLVSLTISAGTEGSTLARDTVFAAVMIFLNGMVGLGILIGGIRYKEQSFGLQGISSALIILVAISVLTMILPYFTTSVPGPFYSPNQLIFIAVVFLAESLAPGLETFVKWMGAPLSLVGIIIAAVVLLPEGLSAIRAARKNQLQISLNLSLGSALASISLTIPTVP